MFSRRVARRSRARGSAFSQRVRAGGRQCGARRRLCQRQEAPLQIPACNSVLNPRLLIPPASSPCAGGLGARRCLKMPGNIPTQSRNRRRQPSSALLVSSRAQNAEGELCTFPSNFLRVSSRFSLDYGSNVTGRYRARHACGEDAKTSAPQVRVFSKLRFLVLLLTRNYRN